MSTFTLLAILATFYTGPLSQSAYLLDTILHESISDPLSTNIDTLLHFLKAHETCVSHLPSLLSDYIPSIRRATDALSIDDSCTAMWKHQIWIVTPTLSVSGETAVLASVVLHGLIVAVAGIWLSRKRRKGRKSVFLKQMQGRNDGKVWEWVYWVYCVMSVVDVVLVLWNLSVLGPLVYSLVLAPLFCIHSVYGSVSALWGSHEKSLSVSKQWISTPTTTTPTKRRDPTSLSCSPSQSPAGYNNMAVFGKPSSLTNGFGMQLDTTSPTITKRKGFTARVVNSEDDDDELVDGDTEMDGWTYIGRGNTNDFRSVHSTAQNLRKLKQQQDALDDTLISGFASIRTEAGRQPQTVKTGGNVFSFGSVTPLGQKTYQEDSSMKLDPPRFFAPQESTGLEELFMQKVDLKDAPAETPRKQGIFSLLFG